jgi:hypothetical protein
MSSARSEDGKRRANCVAPHYSYYLVPLIFHFWGYEKIKCIFTEQICWSTMKCEVALATVAVVHMMTTELLKY